MISFFFFFQAEDGIRDLTVTGVQTCALPISRRSVPNIPISLFRGQVVSNRTLLSFTLIETGKWDRFSCNDPNGPLTLTVRPSTCTDTWSGIETVLSRVSNLVVMLHPSEYVP